MRVCPKCGEVNFVYCQAWRNRAFRGAPYEQYCFPDELRTFDYKLLSLIEKYGQAFDDLWQYKLSGKNIKVIVRTPIWLGKTFFFRDCEKAVRKQPKRDPNQTKLLEDMEKENPT